MSRCSNCDAPSITGAFHPVLGTWLCDICAMIEASKGSYRRSRSHEHSSRPRKAGKSFPMCPYCGKREGRTRDHIIPKSRGGRGLPNNTVLTCSTCNGDKAARTLAEWIDVLRQHGDGRANLVEQFLASRILFV